MKYSIWYWTQTFGPDSVCVFVCGVCVLQFFWSLYWPAHLMLMQMSSRCAFMTVHQSEYTRVKVEDEAASTMQGYTPQTTGRKRKTHRTTVHTASERYTTQADEKHRAATGGLRETKQSYKLHDTLKTRAHCFKWMHVMFWVEWLNVVFFGRWASVNEVDIQYEWFKCLWLG